MGSLAGQLPIKAGEGDGEGLQGAQRVPVVQSEGVLGYAAELEYYIVGWNDSGVTSGLVLTGNSLTPGGLFP